MHPARSLLIIGVLSVSAVVNLLAGESKPNLPADALKTFTVPDDLVWEVALAEPDIVQPVFLNFDERGRMWVVEYRQYPYPAGLKVVSHDSVWRAIYDKVPEPPPKGVPGKDRISIHEDTDGDGVYDKHTVFVDNLNIATAVERGRGGVWVLNPPYLLFYPDADNDDVPDGPPVVHLQGFGLEDTHSVVNSLRWGPDGWLYAAQGSTVTGNVRRPDQPESEAVRTLGQNIWRYHPATKRYEVFAEGGGNAFYVELDAQGRIFSGHNGGDTRGFHYVQGGYLRKGFDKHGPLSNPYAFGYFTEIKHAQKVARFTHGFMKYEGGSFPESYNGKLFAIDPLNHVVVNTELIPQGATFTTRDVGPLVKSSDPWFRPVDIKTGPDGAVYIADWYDPALSHVHNAEGKMEMERGRIYRLRAKNVKPSKPEDLSKLKTPALVDALRSRNRWKRQTALRVLADRREGRFEAEELLQLKEGVGALEGLWLINQLGLVDGPNLKAFEHPDPYVRQWVVRLVCDRDEVSPQNIDALRKMSIRESHVEVRSQLASSARRLPADECMRIVRRLLMVEEDANDAYIPQLLWWAIESKCEKNPKVVLDLFEDKEMWSYTLVRQHILERLMRRFAAAGDATALKNCAELFARSPSPDHTQPLVAGFEKAFEGRAMPTLPNDLLQAMARAGAGSMLLDIRQGKPEALDAAIAQLADPKTKTAKRISLAQILGEVKDVRALPVLLEITLKEKDLALRRGALTALQAFDDPKIADQLIANGAKLPMELATAAWMALTGRAAWTERLLAAIESGAIKKGNVAREVVDALKQNDDPAMKARIEKLWKPAIVLDGETQKEAARVKALAVEGGNPKAGGPLFAQRCGSCHQLFGAGGHVGPDLTSFKRDDLDMMLTNILKPSAEIREGFVNTLVKSKDGRTLTGIVIQNSDATLTLRCADGQDVTLEKTQIKLQKALGVSLMPEGLLEGLSDEDVKNLFAYLRSTQPPK